MSRVLFGIRQKRHLFIAKGNRVKKYIRNSTTLCRAKEPVETPWPRPPEPGWTCTGEYKDGKALILGLYSSCEDPDINQISLTKTAMKYNQFTCGKLVDQLKVSGPFPKLGEARLFYDLEPTFPVIAVVGLGHECYGYNSNEERDEAKEAIRIAAGAGCRALQRLNISKLFVENLGHAESAAEGAGLALWVYQDLKNTSRKQRVPYLGLYDDCDWVAWKIGLEKASAQNLARQLMETPSNLMTPKAFALSAVEALCKTGVNVEVRVQEWASANNMNAFLAVARGSCEPPIFLELSYSGCDPCTPPIVMVGKGITFDSGGLCLKSDDEMQHMRGDMGGAACIVSTIRAVSTLKLPVNIRALIPLCENMPGANAAKPGDIVKAMNGKSILIAQTDFEGQLVLADALCYAQKYKPKFIIDVGTLTKEMQGALGQTATGVFTNNDRLWATIKSASIHTGDRVWRFPLFRSYSKQVIPEHVDCDLTNHSGKSPGGYSCSSAAFLREFVCNFDWIHLDTLGVMLESGETTYMRKGMSGRPTRTLIEFISQLACKPRCPDDIR